MNGPNQVRSQDISSILDWSRHAAVAHGSNRLWRTEAVGSLRVR
jgi:hypothetical protein